jgi:hypothetical protein
MPTWPITFIRRLPKRDIEGNDERLIVRPLYVDLIQGPIIEKQVIRSYQCVTI